MNLKKTLDKLKIGESAKIVDVDGEKALRHHLLEMGLVPDTIVTLLKTAPMGDPLELKVRDYVLTLRKADASEIEIKKISKREVEKIEVQKAEKREKKKIAVAPHPKLAEKINNLKAKRKNEINAYCGRCGHCRGHAGKNVIKNEELRFALVGNQNSGKTTLFNQLTGANQHVGNFPGVTIEHKEGVVKNCPSMKVVDLPGIYSLSPYSTEEVVTRDFIINSKPNGIINILDATNIERNLYLTLQLIELNIPMVLALNMMDEVRENKGVILVNNLEDILGIPVVPISASKNEGINELIQHAVAVAKNEIKPKRIDLCKEDGTTEEQAVHRCIHSIAHLIEDHSKKRGVNPRFAATKIVEGDPIALNSLRLQENEEEAIEHLVKQMEDESGEDRLSAIVNMRFNFIEDLCEKTVSKPQESIGHKRSVKADNILTGKWTAIPVFLCIMAFMFWMTFGLVGPILSKGLEYGIGILTNLVDTGLTNFGLNSVVHSLIIDGIFAGVGSVLSFLPLIIVLFFFLSLMEDSGYMARVAFIMDKPLRKIGLSGKSFVPMLIGFGCSVPAIMATRTLSSKRDRRMTMLLIPYMSCSAKLPIYVMLAGMFFPKYFGLVIVALYILGIIAAILYAVIMKGTRFKGEPIPFVMELPNYRLPSIKSVLLLVWEKAKDFITKAFTVIFFASIVIWFLQTFDYHINVVEDSSQSLLAIIGGFIAPIFEPLGLNDWRISTALLTGFVAKESVVSTFTVLLGSTANVQALFTPVTSIIFLIFTLYYTPCVAAVTAFKRETHSTLKTIAMVVSQCVIAWILAFLFSLILL